MGRISKYSNIYNTNGELVRKVDTKGMLESMTLKEVQDLIDKLGTEKNEYGNIKDPVGFNNASYILMQMYNNPKYSKEKESFIRDLNDRLRVDREGVRRTLERTNRDLEESETSETSADIKLKDIQRDGENGSNKGLKAGDDVIKFNLNGQEVTMSKTDVEKDKEMSKGAFLKSYDVNDNKEECVEYKEN